MFSRLTLEIPFPRLVVPKPRRVRVWRERNYGPSKTFRASKLAGAALSNRRTVTIKEAQRKQKLGK